MLGSPAYGSPDVLPAALSVFPVCREVFAGDEIDRSVADGVPESIDLRGRFEARIDLQERSLLLDVFRRKREVMRTGLEGHRNVRP